MCSFVYILDFDQLKGGIIINVFDLSSTTDSISFSWDERYCLKDYSVKCVYANKSDVIAELDGSDQTGICNSLDSNHNYNLVPYSQTHANFSAPTLLVSKFTSIYIF
jgi:hypothetical protein